MQILCSTGATASSSAAPFPPRHEKETTRTCLSSDQGKASVTPHPRVGCGSSGGALTLPSTHTARRTGSQPVGPSLCVRSLGATDSKLWIAGPPSLRPKYAVRARAVGSATLCLQLEACQMTWVKH